MTDVYLFVYIFIYTQRSANDTSTWVKSSIHKNEGYKIQSWALNTSFVFKN